MKLFPYETRHPHLSNDIWIVGNNEKMKILCPIEVEKFSSSGSPNVCSIFSYNLRFTWLLGMKLIPLESRLKELSNDIWITKIGLTMRKLWPFKIRADF